MNLDSMQEIVTVCRREGKRFWEIILETDMENRGVSRGASLEKMAQNWHTMKEASEVYTGERRSLSGMAGGQGKLMHDYLNNQTPIGGEFIGQVIAEALSMGESNACMRRVVAAPTAGACGVLPAALIPLYWRENLPEDKMLEAMYTASGIGAVIAYRACISGASGGCQAEIGSASAMAAGALVCLRGGTPDQLCHAVAMALKNLMGLACDPVAGLVEVPCIKRNVVGAVNAVAAADMALAGIESRIPVDEVIDAMGEVGRRLPMELRETALGGLAATPTGRMIKEHMASGKKKQRTLTIKDARWKLERKPDSADHQTIPHEPLTST